MTALAGIPPSKSLKGISGQVNLVQGEYAVSADANVALTTILGSCVAACMRDPRVGVGGMNHFLLPGALVGANESVERGVHAMELLINSLLQAGARRDRLEAKLFGGARMMKNLSDIGAKNATFASDFLRQERIPHLGGSLGGEQARRIRFWPVAGKAQQRILGQSEAHVFARELSIAATPTAPADDVEFF
ncbi:putative chemoreceptor glutamine deamidase CheD [uncultured Defluviicoccus sp.]|uniref:Putative chemoreceptor glutamine deamidase CheD n=1 Tax=metagenome TaxID=256318 RepID=A0A380T7B6_9ZZZZ|nr:putative chemoreceptor glutamine deamidase CheD [uncultured Defluviicoccus sp.]